MFSYNPEEPRKARKSHKCELCRRNIKKGSIYIKTAINIADKLVLKNFHPECLEILHYVTNEYYDTYKKEMECVEFREAMIEYNLSIMEKEDVAMFNELSLDMQWEVTFYKYMIKAREERKAHAN